MLLADTANVTQWWAPALAFLAGAVSFASPCVFPLVPGYLAFVTGESVVDDPVPAEGSKRVRLVPIFLFIGGFTLVFTLYGAFSATFVRIFKGTAGQAIAGAFVVLLGLLMVGYGLQRGPLAIYAERRPLLGRMRPGAAGAFPLGMAFAAGWTPCIGPVLAAILLVASQQSAGRGAFLLICYSLGLGVPFLLIGIGIQWLTGVLTWVKRHYATIAIVSGAFLVGVGVLLMTGLFTRYLVTPLLRFAPQL
jgi:cytochrome c-type biogenesis protein